MNWSCRRTAPTCSRSSMLGAGRIAKPLVECDPRVFQEFPACTLEYCYVYYTMQFNNNWILIDILRTQKHPSCVTFGMFLSHSPSRFMQVTIFNSLLVRPVTKVLVDTTKVGKTISQLFGAGAITNHFLPRMPTDRGLCSCQSWCTAC